MLGFQVNALAGEPLGEVELIGWNAVERETLLATIAARQPFLDFVLSRVKDNGTLRQFRVSGEPMFSQSCRYIGYRGIGVEISAK